MIDETLMPSSEPSIERRLRAYADVPNRRLDANLELAAAAAATRAQRRMGWRLRGLPAMPGLRPLLVGAVLLALASAALAVVGMRLRSDAPPLPGRLAYSSSDGGLFLADADGHESRKVREGRFGTPKWSPDGRYLAVDRSPNAVDILRADGTLVEEVAGGEAGLEFAWAPGAPATSRLAVLINGALVVKDLDAGASLTVTAGFDDAISTWGWASQSTLVWQRTPWARPQASYEVLGAELHLDGTGLTGSPASPRVWQQSSDLLYRSFSRITLSPDGTTLAMTPRFYGKLAMDLGTVPVVGGLIRSLSIDLPTGSMLAWTADSRAIIIESLVGGGTTQLAVVPLDGSEPQSLFEQQQFDDWFLVDDSPVDLQGKGLLLGKVTSPVNDASHTSAPIMDLYVLDRGITTPHLIVPNVLGADVFWSR